MAEELVLKAIRAAWHERRQGKGVTVSLLLRSGVPYSQAQLYRICDALAVKGKLYKQPWRGYFPCENFS